MTEKKEKIKRIITVLEQQYPNVHCPLHHANTLQLLIAVMLSAQCTDERVNRVTPALFQRFKTAHDFATTDVTEIERYVRSTGFFHTKARNIKEACKTIVDKYEGNVPGTMAELLSLRGVARKTANVVLATAFHEQEGIVVDTHVIRLTNLIGLVKTKNPAIIERKLLPYVPIQKRDVFSLLLIFHGRKICIARRPKCMECVIRQECAFGKRAKIEKIFKE